MNQLAGGWIYVLMTSTDYNRFKVGRTKRNPLSRVKTLRCGDPGIDIEVAFFVPASHGKLSRVEVDLHRQFGGRILFHDESESEWFTGNPKFATQAIEGIFIGWWEEDVTDMAMLGQGRICRAYEENLIDLYGPRVPLNPVDGMPW